MDSLEQSLQELVTLEDLLPCLSPRSRTSEDPAPGEPVPTGEPQTSSLPSAVPSPVQAPVTAPQGPLSDEDGKQSSPRIS